MQPGCMVRSDPGPLGLIKYVILNEEVYSFLSARCTNGFHFLR